MTALSTWTPLTLFVVIVVYAIITMVLLVAPMLVPVVREAWRARRESREPNFVLLQPYPVYLLRFRRAFRLLLIPPVLLAAVWVWARL